MNLVQKLAAKQREATANRDNTQVPDQLEGGVEVASKKLEPASSSTSAPSLKLGGLSLGKKPDKPVSKLSGLSLPKTTKPPVEPAPTPAPAPAPKPTTGLKMGGAIGNLMNKASEPRRTIYTGITDLSPTAEHITSSGDFFDLNMLMEDWPAVEDDDDDDIAENQELRNAHIKRAVDRLNQVFADQLDALRICDAAHPVMVEIGRIVKLTFMRVQSSPAAYRALGNEDRSTIIRALQIMGDKRAAAQKSIKGGKKENSQTLEDATNPYALAESETSEALSILDSLGDDDIFGP